MATVDVQTPPYAQIGLFQRLLQFFGLKKCRWGDPERCAAFTSAFVALAAKMAKADGVAVEAEAETFEKFLNASPAELTYVRRLYQQAKQDTLGFESYADRISEILKNDDETKHRVFECLFYVACSDGVLHHAEDKFLRSVAERFGYDDGTFRAIRATFVHDPGSPYAVLDISPNASDAEIKSRYRKLVSENHPDLMIADKAPPAIVKAATAKVAAYNNAYDQIQRERAHTP